MHIISKSALKDFWERHEVAKAALEAWYLTVKKANWQNSQDIKRDFGNSVDFLSDNRIIFDIKGNNYRLIAKIEYNLKRVYIKNVLTHKEYDRMRLN